MDIDLTISTDLAGIKIPDNKLASNLCDNKLASNLCSVIRGSAWRE